MAKHIYVFDTSACLTDASCIKSFGRNDIVIPLKVLDEIDSQKKRQDGVGANARFVIRHLDNLRENGNLNKGVRIGKGMGILSVKNYDPTVVPDGFSLKSPDNQIIATALTEKNINPRKKIIVVTKDINMRVKCDALGVLSEDYQGHNIVKDPHELFVGIADRLVDDEMVDQFYAGEEVHLPEELEKNLMPNEFVMLVSSANNKKTALTQFQRSGVPLKKIMQYDNIWGVNPRNKEQTFAFSLLMNPDIPVVSLIGKAGTGKTLLAIAAGLEQIMGGQNYERYKKLIVSRPVQPLGKDIGFLPGTLEEKMMPWIAPLRDNLEYLFGDKTALDIQMEQGVVEIEAMTYIRGRSISNAFMIVDEAQNLTTHELKTIITRVGHGTKLILTGDVQQIDNSYVDAVSNGLTYAVEKFKTYDISGHVTLHKGERSKLATLAAEIL